MFGAPIVISGVLQDWTTQHADAGTNALVVSVLQGEHGYLDTSEFDDIVFYLDVRELTTTGTLSIAYETSISRDSASFVAMVPAVSLAVATTPVVTRVLAAYSPIPPARYVRWHLTTNQITGVWDACFRITYAAYAPGS